jgi:uncharacterized protein YdhG (YjbR/CyaY superfamily)
MNTRQAFATVPDYLSSLEPEQAKALNRVLALFRKSFPGSQRVISYGIPAFKQDRVFIYCAAFKAHIGIYPPVRNDASLVKTLKPYANAKGNLRIPLDEPLPMPLIARVAKPWQSNTQRSSDAAGNEYEGRQRPATLPLRAHTALRRHGRQRRELVGRARRPAHRWPSINHRATVWRQRLGAGDPLGVVAVHPASAPVSSRLVIQRNSVSTAGRSGVSPRAPRCSVRGMALFLKCWDDGAGRVTSQRACAMGSCRLVRGASSWHSPGSA